MRRHKFVEKPTLRGAIQVREVERLEVGEGNGRRKFAKPALDLNTAQCLVDGCQGDAKSADVQLPNVRLVSRLRLPDHRAFILH